MESDLAEKLNKDLEKQLGKHGKKIADEKVNEKLHEFDKKVDQNLAGLQGKLAHKAEKYGMSLLTTVYSILFAEQIPVLGVLLINYFFSILVSLLVAVGILIVALIYLVIYFIIYKYPKWVKTGSLGFFFAIVLSFLEAFFVVYVGQAISEANLVIAVVSVLMVDLFCVALMAHFMKNFKCVYAIALGFVLITGIFLGYVLTMEFSWFNTAIIYVVSNLYQVFIVMITESVLKDKNVDDEKFETAIFVTLLVYKEKINYTVGLLITIVLTIVKCCKKNEGETKN